MVEINASTVAVHIGRLKLPQFSILTHPNPTMRILVIRFCRSSLRIYFQCLLVKPVDLLSIQDYFSHDPSADAINRTRTAVADVKNIMVENIEKVGDVCTVLACSRSRQLQAAGSRSESRDRSGSCGHVVSSEKSTAFGAHAAHPEYSAQMPRLSLQGRCWSCWCISPQDGAHPPLCHTTAHFACRCWGGGRR